MTTRYPLLRAFAVRPRWRWIAGCVLAMAASGLYLGNRLGRAQATSATAATAASRARANAGYLASELRKYRLLPLILADYPDVQQALDAGMPSGVARLNARLELIAQRTDAAAIYLVDARGRTVAASNWRLPTSFIGQNYGFRPYFTGAMARGAAEQFALGTVSRRPGLFLARRVTGAPGVIVVKVEFNTLEASWSHQTGPTIVRDRNGVVIMTTQPGWRLRGTRPLPGPTRLAIQNARLYGEGPLLPLAPDLALLTGAAAVDVQRRHYVTATLPVPVAGWTLTTLEPLDPALFAATAQARIALLAGLLILVVLAGLFVRAREKQAMRESARRDLVREVALRTAELRGANAQLIHESRERERGEAGLRAAREELAQSNRLATLGQITAGVAHEINQPLAALRTFAENTSVMLAQGKLAAAQPNLDRIVSLSERIGDITGELKLFARRDHSRGPVALEAAIAGALLLVGDRVRMGGVAVERTRCAGDPQIACNRVRIEQILVNLLQNACDALAGRPAPRIAIETRVEHGWASIAVRDNGPGIDDATRARLFTSFATSKPAGLGLGLVISRDLARDMGGELTHEPSVTGAGFLVRLPLA